MTILFSDAFPGADETPIGGNWETLSGMPSGARKVSNQLAATTANTDGVSRVKTSAATFPADQYAQWRLAVLGGGDGSGILRASADDDYIFTTNYNAANIFIYEVVASSFSNIGDSGTTFTWATNDILLLQVIGTAITSKQNSVTRAVATASIASGQAGAYCYDGTIRLDDYEAGDFSVASSYVDSLLRRNHPGRGPYSLRAYRRRDSFANVITSTEPPAPPPVTPELTEDSRRPRPGFGPYSLGRYFRRRDDAFTPAAAAGGEVTVAPGNASLSFQGLVATIQALSIASPTNASLSFQGLAPVVYSTIVTTPENASLSYAGLAPTVYLQNVLTPANASLSFAGLAPTLYLHATIEPGNASLSFAGFAPLVIGDNGVRIAIDNASLSFGGLEPTLLLHKTLEPEPASLSFQGLAPTVNTQGVTRGHVNTGRRWRGRVYGLSYSSEVAIVPTIGREPLPMLEQAEQIGLGELDPDAAIEAITPAPKIIAPTTLLPEVDADAEAAIARDKRRKRRVRAAQIFVHDEQQQVRAIEAHLLALVDVMIEQRARSATSRGNKRHGRNRI